MEYKGEDLEQPLCYDCCWTIVLTFEECEGTKAKDDDVGDTEVKDGKAGDTEAKHEESKHAQDRDGGA